MNCEDIRELLPAYVLGALEPEEREIVEAHLRGGREHDQELVELRATVFALDRFVEEPQPSAALAERVSHLFAARNMNLLEIVTHRLLRSPALGALAAVLVLLVVFGAGWLSAQTFGSNSGQHFTYTLQGGNGELLTLHGGEREAEVTVVMAGLPRLPSGQSYQLWVIRDGVWLPIGICNTNAEGKWRGRFPFSMRAGEEVALTVERAGGSPIPAGESILRTFL